MSAPQRMPQREVRAQQVLREGLLAQLRERSGQWLGMLPLIAATGESAVLVLAALDALVQEGHVHHARRRSEELWGVGVEGTSPTEGAEGADVNSQCPEGQEGKR